MKINAELAGAVSHTLDLPGTYASLDPSHMSDRLAALPRQCIAGWQQSSSFRVPESWRSPDRVIIGGMGGSAIAGELVSDLASALGSRASFTLVRDFKLPFAVDERCLVIACSHSGNTAETLSLFQQAAAQQCHVMALTGGGLLAEAASSYGFPVIPVNAPGEPRNSVGFNLMALLGTLHNLGLLQINGAEVQAAIQRLEQDISRLLPEVPCQDNAAKQLASQLDGRLTVIYGGGIFSGLARRWKSQFNENAKAWAFFETLPELLHNAVEGQMPWGEAGDTPGVVLLKPRTMPVPLRDQYDIVEELLADQEIPCVVVQPDEGPPLYQILSGLAWGDYTSYYLALLRGQDPAPTTTIDRAKARLKHKQDP